MELKLIINDKIENFPYSEHILSPPGVTQALLSVFQLSSLTLTIACVRRPCATRPNIVLILRDFEIVLKIFWSYFQKI